jgi:hypothetical protein
MGIEVTLWDQRAPPATPHVYGHQAAPVVGFDGVPVPATLPAAFADLVKWLEVTKTGARDLVQESCLQDQQILFRSLPDRRERNASIKSNELTLMLNRESKQVYVGQLPRSMNSGGVQDIRIQQADCILPEFMDILAAGLG